MSFEVTNANGKTWLYESYNLGYMQAFDCRMDAIDALRRLTGKPVIGREPSSEPVRRATEAIANNKRAQEYRANRKAYQLEMAAQGTPIKPAQPIIWKWQVPQ